MPKCIFKKSSKKSYILCLSPRVFLVMEVHALKGLIKIRNNNFYVCNQKKIIYGRYIFLIF